MALTPREVVLQWFHCVWNERLDHVIDEILDDKSICHTDHGPVSGCAEFRQKLYEPMLAAFPDLKIEVQDLVAEGNRVVIRWVATATHGGGGLGFAPTGKPIRVQGISWILVENGRFREGWQLSNLNEVIAGLQSQP